jgi:hypothetical protein
LLARPGPPPFLTCGRGADAVVKGAAADLDLRTDTVAIARAAQFAAPCGRPGQPVVGWSAGGRG